MKEAGSQRHASARSAATRGAVIAALRGEIAAALRILADHAKAGGAVSLIPTSFRFRVTTRPPREGWPPELLITTGNVATDGISDDPRKSTDGR